MTRTTSLLNKFHIAERYFYCEFIFSTSPETVKLILRISA